MKSTPIIATEQFFGHATDFEVKQERVGDTIKITATTVAPLLRKSGDHFVSFPPPRYPWRPLTPELEQLKTAAYWERQPE